MLFLKNIYHVPSVCLTLGKIPQEYKTKRRGCPCPLGAHILVKKIELCGKISGKDRAAVH